MTYQQFLSSANLDDTWYTRTLYAQAKHETGSFTSNVYREANNLFGMRPSTERYQFYVAIYGTDENPYAFYNSHSFSIMDRIDLDQVNGNNGPTEYDEVGGYMQSVQESGYAEDPDYVDKWFEHFRALNNDLEGIVPVNSSGGVNPIGISFKNPLWKILILLLLLWFGKPILQALWKRLRR